MKQLPNIFTLLNLFFGCIAIVYILQSGLVPLYTNNGGLLMPDISDLGTQYVSIPEQMFMASLFIALAAVVDFFDGFVARWMKATSAIGAQLDSLADVVSFGVAPSLIVYQFLRLSFAQQDNGLDVSFIFLVPAFIIACAGAYRLARFNLDTEHTNYFKGVPIPANGLLIASFPLIYWTNNYSFITDVLISPWFWYAIIIILSWLMVSKKPMMALKFSNINIKKLLPFIIIAVVAIISSFIIQWLAVPLCFLLYVILSLFNKPKSV
ncbi:MAG TPA: CDP-alcohol phosphatidyltransferase family protein [Parafilimonas sp.]